MTGPKPKSSSTTTAASSSSGNIRVVARIRPLAKYEIENGSKQIVHALPTMDNGKENDDGNGLGGPEVLEVRQQQKKWFELDAVFGGDSKQHDVYKKSGAQNAVCQDIFKGFNCTILAYGQTGAGKTFTMGTAASSSIGEHDGIIPRATSDLFRMINEKCDGNANVELSYMEIYNEEIRDLMDDNSKPESLRIRETLNGEVYVSGLKSQPVAGPEEIGKCMEEASQRRMVASTKMNATSSRSHAICVLNIKGVLEDSTKFQAKLTLVDLAGSERIKKTGAQGNRRQEGININKGLFILGQVVSALAEQRPKYKRKPPYRDSKLTRLLQDSLGGNSRTIMVACVSPADFNIDETTNTLRYATSARNIKNTATRNVIKSISPEEAAKLQRENQLLKAQVKELQETIQKMAEASEPTPSVASTDSTSDVDEGSDIDNLEGGDSTSNKRIKELEAEVKQLKETLSCSSSGDDGGDISETPKSPKKSKDKDHIRESIITQTMAENAIEVPELHRKIKELEEELEFRLDLEEENDQLFEELEEARAECNAANLAATKMSSILEQLEELKGDEIDKKNMELEHILVEEAWVGFVSQVLESNKDQIQKLRDDFYLVTRVVESPEFPTSAPSNSNQPLGAKWWQQIRKGRSGDRQDQQPHQQSQSAPMTIDPEMRQELLSQHIQFFNDKLTEVEKAMDTEAESLSAIRDSLEEQRNELELEIGCSEFEMESMVVRDNDLLEQLTTLLVGPVRNLGDYD